MRKFTHPKNKKKHEWQTKDIIEDPENASRLT